MIRQGARACALLLVLALPVNAEVMFDPATGTGSVERKDVQHAFGKPAIEAPELVQFFMTQIVSYTVECRHRTTREIATFPDHRRTRWSLIDVEVISKPHGSEKVESWSLQGIGATVERRRWCPNGFRLRKATLTGAGRFRLSAEFDGTLHRLWRQPTEEEP